jgi:Holliday junction resolvase RusA-like endonuclease
MNLNFILPRPATIKASKRPYPIVAPDIDKLARAAADSLQGIFYVDDSQVVRLSVSKDYGEAPGVTIAICEMTL